MYPIDRLVLDGWCPPYAIILVLASNSRPSFAVKARGPLTTIREHHRVGRYQVEAHAADAQAGQHDSRVGVVLEGVDGGVALDRAHASVQPRERVALRR